MYTSFNYDCSNCLPLCVFINSATSGDNDFRKNALATAQTQSSNQSVPENKVDGYSEGITPDTRSEAHPSKESGQPPKLDTVSQSKQGALPEGFFDDKDADLRARGITPVKPDVK